VSAAVDELVNVDVPDEAAGEDVFAAADAWVVARPPFPSVRMVSHTVRNAMTEPTATQPRMAAMRGVRLEGMATGSRAPICSP
jgi:hypothetical protein